MVRWILEGISPGATAQQREQLNAAARDSRLTSTHHNYVIERAPLPVQGHGLTGAVCLANRRRLPRFASGYLRQAGRDRKAHAPADSTPTAALAREGRGDRVAGVRSDWERIGSTGGAGTDTRER